MKKVLIIFIVLSFFLPGCGLFDARDEKTAQELASEGVDGFKNGRYSKSIESFEKLKDWYPFSKYAILAELKIADAHYCLKEYEEAIFAYEEFENLHPNNEVIPYVVYQIGLCYFEQISTPDRDQTSASKAKSTFNRLIKQFPQNKYALKGKEFVKKCDKSLAEAVFGIGVHYYKNKHYKGALARFKEVISNYSDVGIHQWSLQYIAMCEASLKENRELTDK
ncbi:MAG: outer membrane protein assembly factor BamD [Deltaproteobacteria bacterium]|nr:outer membrane protein assembly factor BamD [Deltaproteobacteria bacterium]MBW2661934.1 outer membrane protein assembly factor BamD [Deltaproteobacteria bacterium]